MITSKALGRNHIAYYGPKHFRNAMILLNSPTLLVSHSTLIKNEEPTHSTEIYGLTNRLPYNIESHLTKDYSPKEPVLDLQQKINNN